MYMYMYWSTYYLLVMTSQSYIAVAYITAIHHSRTSQSPVAQSVAIRTVSRQSHSQSPFAQSSSPPSSFPPSSSSPSSSPPSSSLPSSPSPGQSVASLAALWLFTSIKGKGLRSPPLAVLPSWTAGSSPGLPGIPGSNQEANSYDATKHDGSDGVFGKAARQRVIRAGLLQLPFGWVNVEVECGSSAAVARAAQQRRQEHPSPPQPHCPALAVWSQFHTATR
jgi:hypothetical protein